LPLRRHQVGVGELDFFFAADDTDLVVDVVGLVADFPNLVGDPEFEPIGAVGLNDGDRLFLASVFENETHVPLGDGRLILARFAGLAERDVLEAGLFGRLPLIFGLGLDDGELELAAPFLLIERQEVGEIAHEGVELGQALRDVGIDVERAFQRRHQTTATQRKGEAFVLGHVHALVHAGEGDEIGDDDDGGDDDEIEARFGGCFSAAFHDST